MKEQLRPAIEALKAELRDLERRVSETKQMINRLCELSGAPPEYDDVTMPAHRSIGTLRADQFYGKVLTTAAREYLEMRKASNRGPASPREIYEALVEGGYKFDTKNDENAIIGLRQTLRKNSAIFHRLPNGQYGLLAWYPNAKAAKPDDNAESGTADSRRVARRSVKRPRRSTKPRMTVKRKKLTTRQDKAVETDIKPRDDDQKAQSGAHVAERVFDAMRDGADWTIDRLKQEVPGTSGRVIQGALISLLSRNLVTRVEKGIWRITTITDTDRIAQPTKVIPMKASA